VTWDIHTGGGVVQAQSLSPPVPSNMRGERVRLRFRFDSTSSYESVREYLDYAGASVTGTALDGSPYFRELQADGDGLVMGFVPSSSIPTVPGLWGLLVGGQELTRLPPADLALELEVFYLDEYPNQGSIADVRGSFEL